MFAYVDPGLGLLAWQALVAAFLGGLFYLKKTRVLLVGFFVRLFRIGKPKPQTVTKISPESNTGK